MERGVYNSVVCLVNLSHEHFQGEFTIILFNNSHSLCLTDVE